MANIEETIGAKPQLASGLAQGVETISNYEYTEKNSFPKLHSIFFFSYLTIFYI